MNNPLLADWDTPYGLPPFDKVQPALFAPAFAQALPAHLAELDAIASSGETPDFDNTIAAFDRSGRLVSRLSLLFENLTSSETSPALQAVELELAPTLAGHRNAIYLHDKLFARIDVLHARRDALDLQPEQLRLLERIHLDFVRAGAKLPEAAKARYGQLMERMAELEARFAQNVLADEAAFALPLREKADFAGLPDYLVAAARNAAAQRGLPEGSHIITLSPSLAEPFLSFSSRRDLREALWRARVSRGAHPGEHDNRPIASELVSLRQEQARLHGYPSFAHYQLADRMAGTPDAVSALLEKVWEPAKAKAAVDREALTEMAKSLGEPVPIAAWDWRYLAEKVRQQRFSLDDAELKPYFRLENMIAAMFDCATRLFGIRFEERHSVPLHHPDARLWEVHDAAGKLIGLFIGDNFARPSKRSGAWMHVFRNQSGHGGGTLPIVINNNNFAKAQPTLLSFEDVRTLFHEFGHGLHGLLSLVNYERLSGTQVLQDFVELPSQLFEHWAQEEAVLQRFATHVTTGEPMPAALRERLKRARRFNQAWETVMYTGPALIDMALHSLPHGTQVDIAAFETEQQRILGIPEDIGQRHYLSHFQHLFGGPYYAAGYYVYMWAEVLDADGYDAFLEAGDPFHEETAKRLLRHVYSAGNTQDPTLAYRAFRGRDPRVEPMLAKRGLIAAPAH
ncbi:M3 family metallopeptidase [Noviherbaspirillum galbum]|uniref:M3 family metallopeptidase n=1 Tax=Noviherbaspirillum galbum TaxID=2709383 RepID=UPI002E2B3DF9|nr:M3 family metallopeptidase [Noviherbaspirillum galbum]